MLEAEKQNPERQRDIPLINDALEKDFSAYAQYAASEKVCYYNPLHL